MEKLEEAQGIIADYCKIIGISPPKVTFEVCSIHQNETWGHYCSRTIYTHVYEGDVDLYELAHELFHYVFDLCRKGEFDTTHEEGFTDLFCGEAY